MWLRAERLSETAIAFARAGRASDETGVAFAGAGRASDETAIAFAGEKWAFLACFLVAEVMVVSMVTVWGRALVMAVSCWPTSAVAEVSLVSTSPRHSCLSAKKFAQRTKNGPKSAFCGVPGEFFAKTPLEGSRRAKFFAEQPRNRACWPSSVAPPLRHACCWATFVSGRIGKRPAGNATDGWA